MYENPFPKERVWAMYLVVCYDIVSDRRRARVLRKTKAYLTRVQKSVCEGELADDRLDALRRMLLEEIDPVEDTVRIFHLCARCVPATDILGLGTYVDRDDADEVI
ncbi:MAG: CRISPR-associated endonuclease Cas2 [Planctomycetes bacterium]|nr:CRISPR-associated endonuclease Cas2 [Planctomycetota bacterium]